MGQTTAIETAAAARRAITEMVQPAVQVIVQIDRMLPDDHRNTIRLARTVRPASTAVVVEMVGPAGLVYESGKTIIDQGEARAWCNDEIPSAARRAAEGIIRRNPTWRRRAGPAESHRPV
jgi:hypothetical protein